MRFMPLATAFLLTGTAAAQQGPTPSPAALTPVAAETPAPGTDISFVDVEQRMTVPVSIAGHGPFDFIIDTGAERTVISRELAGRLALSPGPTVRLTAMSGTANVDTVVIPSLNMSPIDYREEIHAPALAQRNLGGPGLIGLDTLKDHALAIDFVQTRMTVTPSTKRRKTAPAGPDEIVVRAAAKGRQLIVTEASFEGRRIKVVLDTGSTVTVGNAAFRRQVARATHRPFQPITLTSVTGGQTIADYSRVDNLKVGGVLFKGLPVAFAEVVPFERLGLSRQPALMLGMDALRAFRRVNIDFPNREVRFSMPRPEKMARDAEAPPVAGAGQDT